MSKGYDRRMSLAKAYSAQLVGLTSSIITIEVDISPGLHAFSVVGLGDRSVDEAKDRIAAAIKNSGYTSPKQRNHKVVISLAPADMRKEGPAFDLAMALAYLAAIHEISFSPEGKIFLGELSLEGRVRKVSGLLPILCQAAAEGYSEAFIPAENSEEASMAQGISVYPVSCLKEVIDHVSGRANLPALTVKNLYDISGMADHDVSVDMRTIRGNESAKRGLEIAAAGAHNVLMCGPPGTGKTMLAKSMSSILPSLTYEEAVEVTGIHSAARVLGPSLILRPPFRSPHHTASYPSIVGGGTIPRPGEITLAHRGVLFLDEFPEFDRMVIEALRQPLEERFITISRARAIITFPAQCIFIASMNPCPCGRGRERGCTCTAKALESYRRKISGPIMDRLDIWLGVNKVEYEKLSAGTASAEDSSAVRSRVEKARLRSLERYACQKSRKKFNSEMSAEDMEKFSLMEDKSRTILSDAAAKLEMSGRSFHRTIKVARTIADLGGTETIKPEHILEALQYRQKII